MEIDRQFLKGSISLLLLNLLSRGEMYGYEILQEAARRSANAFEFKEGTLYPVLRTLNAGGYLTSRVVPSYSGPPRRYYRITPEGRARLAQWSGIWHQTRNFVDRFVAGAAT